MIAHQCGPLAPVLPVDPLLPFGAYLGFASNRPGQFVPVFPLGPPLPHPPLEAAPVLAQFPPFLLMTPVQLAPLLPLPLLQIPHKLPPSQRRRLIPGGIPARRDLPAADLRFAARPPAIPPRLHGRTPTHSPRSRPALFSTRCGQRIRPCSRSYPSAHRESLR